ncbi:unnamed protein product [Lactuca virosa]|uniref:Exostosin GT47 domain-containing protein n=1 Tax=Lactuca virosa TaxID=75947 RepID=A0AAU9NCF3_9ASTR|nr:unnamed protein product [Lactuca virosa]
MREALTLSRNCYLDIATANYSKLPWDININDLRKRLLLPPARNVPQLSFKTIGDECLWERSPFFDAFFEICHPEHVLANPDMHNSHNNHFCRLMSGSSWRRRRRPEPRIGLITSNMFK